MQSALAYPHSSYHPPLVDLADKSERDRLSAGATTAFFNIMAAWSVRDEDARALLGGVSNGTFYALKKGTGKPLDEDRLRRISYLIGIFKALNILHGPVLADRWMQLPNANRIFGGSTALAYLVKGGLPAFQTLRRLLDARRGG